jgi:hypothetical protein
VRVNANERAEVAASLAAHSELGPHYDSAVAEGLIERIGEEIDRRVDARLRGGQQPAPAPPTLPAGPGFSGVPGFHGVPGTVAPQPQSAPQRRSNGVTGMILGLGSLGLGVGATAVVVNGHVSSAAAVIMVLLIWVAIAIVNAAHSQRR